MPCYDEWDALFYLTWYQPSQINLAYTLARKIPVGKNPLRTGKGRLQVLDFGCGALAMQFGLALAGAKTLKKRGKCPRIAIVSKDESEHMRRIGKKVWCRFRQEIKDADRYPQLEELRQVCSTMKIRKGHKRTSAIRWLTALHVAYKENADDVKDELDERVGTWGPNVVLVTTHREAHKWTYSPHDLIYREHHEVLSDDDLAPFEGCLEATTKFRRCLHESYSGTIDHMTDSQAEERIAYYLSNPVRWKRGNLESTCRFFLRR